MTHCNRLRGSSEQENLFAFLDDVYFTSPTPNRTRTAYDSLGEKLHAHAGIQLHTGKTRVWNRASVCPEGMVELGPEVWNSEGVKVLGTPVGSTRFVEEVVNKRLEEEAKLWEAIPTVPDLQAAWQILLQCAGPRCHHMLRTLPPSQSEEYAQAHDAGMLRVMDTLLALSGDPQEVEVAHNIASLPMRLGSLGLRSTQIMAPAAYWASWANALYMIDQRLPVVAASVAHKLTVEEELGGCLEKLRNAAAHLDRDSFIGRPHWHDLRTGIRPGAAYGAELGGRTAGNTTLLHFPSTPSGRTWC